MTVRERKQAFSYDKLESQVSMASIAASQDSKSLQRRLDLFIQGLLLLLLLVVVETTLLMT